MPSNFDKLGIQRRCVDRRVEKNFSQAEVARLAECKQQSVAEIEKCGSYSLGLLEKVAGALDVPLEWLRTGSGPMEIDADARSRKSNVRPAPPIKTRPVPVVSYAMAGKANDYEDLGNFLDETIETDCKDPNCFGLIVEGDSMEPVIRGGDRVVVMPNAEPQSGDIVVARRAHTHEVFVKLLHFGDSGKRVKFTSYNPAYPPLEFSRRDFRFIYPVHSMQRVFRRGENGRAPKR